VKLGAAALSFCWFAMLGCASRTPPPSELVRPQRTAASTEPKQDAPQALSAAELAEVPSVTYGPYLGVRPDGAIVVWASLIEGKRRFSVVTLSAEGRPRGEPRAVADAPNELGIVAARPFGSGHVVVYTRKSSSEESLEALCLDASGKPLSAPSALGSVPGQVLWIESIATEQGALVLYASRPASGRKPAEIGAIALGSGCRGQSPASLVKEALAWQAVALGSGAFLAVVRPVQGAAQGFGSVEGQLLDAYGNERAKLTINREPSADLDLDAISLGDRAVVGFSDQRGLEPRVVTAVVDANGALLEAPAPLTPSDGEQTLVRLVPAGKRGYVAWENLRASLNPTRRLQLSALDEKGRLSGPRAELDYTSDDGGVPELVAGPRGLAALTVAPVCPRSGQCSAATTAPFFVEFGPSFEPVAAEPLRLQPLGGRRAEIAFGLGCSVSGCFSLAALARAPAPVFATELEARSDAWRIPARRLDASERPRVLEEQALTLTDSVADFALVEHDGAPWLAHVTEFDATVPWKPLLRPAADGRFDPLRAKVVLERPAQGLDKPAPLPASPISFRAHSLAGVTLAEGAPGEKRSLLAWGGVDQAEPQVFVTLLGSGGKKEAQRMLTRKKGALGGIAAVWVGDGWVVGWIDSRSGSPLVYATRLDARLNRATREQQLSPADGSASDLALAFDGTSLYAVFADARGKDSIGRADVFARRLDPKDASPVADEQRLSSTREHSFAPVLAPHAGSFQVAWLERGGEEGATGSVVVRSLADSGLGVPVTRPIEQGRAGALGLTCSGESCRLAITVELEENRQSTLAVATLGASGLSPLARVLDLGGTRGIGVAPVIVGDAVAFVSATSDRAAIRRATLAW
jgi:hypothetical protein